MTRVPEQGAEPADGYERVNHKVWVREASYPILDQIDTVILDIDGVVIDVSSSFRVAISQTAQLYLTREIGFTGDDILITPVETQLFKLAGGYNNDWDLTAAAIMFYLTKSELLGVSDTHVLRREGMPLDEFAAAAGRAGGGMHGAMAVLLPLLTKQGREKVEKRYDREKIETLFQELYGGVDYCETIYGHKPVFNKRKGLINYEKTMLDKHVLKAFLPRIGVLTGRTEAEARVALKQAGLDTLVRWENVVYDTGLAPDMRKPNPGELIKLAGKLGGKAALYVGDVMDDLNLVKNANVDLSAPCVFASAMIASRLRREEAALFRKEGADIVSLDVNEALKLIISRRQ